MLTFQGQLLYNVVVVCSVRNHYICGVFAARLMVPRKQGLIINVSSAGGLSYLFNVAYGIGKEAVRCSLKILLFIQHVCHGFFIYSIFLYKLYISDGHLTNSYTIYF